MSIVQTLEQGVLDGIRDLYGQEVDAAQVSLSPTRKEFEGDYTVVVFPFTRLARKKPEEIGAELGQWLQDRLDTVTHFNVIKGFLNLSISDAYWRRFLNDMYRDDSYGLQPARDERFMVEFSSPNTNKPLHLGHIRNILLGWSVSRLYEALGYEVVRVQIVNDRGIAICKSMLAWQQFGQGATPASTGIKGDHLVGKYYVLFEQKFQEEYQAWQQSESGQAVLRENRKEGQTEKDFFKAFKNTYFNEYSPLGAQARDMLLNWEAGEPDTVALWKQMNGWVYEGFDQTYDQLGVEFHKTYYESDTYLYGKDIVAEGLEREIFFRKDDGSVWVDLRDAKLDEKLLLRRDGTSVYMTQDLGTARMRYEDYGARHMVYVVGDEQNYHFQVLFEILNRLEEPYADGLHHLSYGMVDLPTGKMKSREGTVVDADDLIAEVIEEARKNSLERGTLAELSPEERDEVIRKVGLAALKFFIVKVHPQKRMVFDPKESVDLQGQTGPYVQNAYVRIQSVLRKAGKLPEDAAGNYTRLLPGERDLIARLYAFPEVIAEAARTYDPSEVANYCYDLAKAYHKFYHDHSILRAESEAAKAFRLQLSTGIARVLRNGMDLLGIDMPDRM